jgi:hypothetical protein
MAETIWYRVNYKHELEPVRVLKETAHFITTYSDYWKREMRISKEDYYATREEAIKSIIEEAERRVTHARNNLDSANTHLAQMREKYDSK